MKHYSTGALFADWIPVLARGRGRHAARRVRAARRARADGRRRLGRAWASAPPPAAPSASTASPVPADRVVPAPPHLPGPPTARRGRPVAARRHRRRDRRRRAGGGGASSSAPRAGRGSRAVSRRAAEDPLLIQRFGELAVQVRAAEALLRGGRPARWTRPAPTSPTTPPPRRRSPWPPRRCRRRRRRWRSASALFEVAGTRSALDALNLHRHWRDARTHTLHDPARWKIQHIGRYVLNGTRPPRHGLL